MNPSSALCPLPLALCSRIALLDTLIDEVGEDESHPLASFMEVVGILIEEYEDEQVPELAVE